MTFPDGDSYVGEWKNGNMNGWGAFYWNNGNSYQAHMLMIQKVLLFKSFISREELRME